jgi:CRP-like cAMP-binding protein
MTNDDPSTVAAEANWLLRSLPDAEYAAVEALTETIEVERKTVLYDPGELISHAWFPQSGCLSCVTIVDDGIMVETGAIGFEGMTGLPLVNGVPQVAGKCFVQIGGTVKRIPRAEFTKAMRTFPAFSEIMHRYAQISLDHAGQTTACNARHTVLQRCAKWLLCTRDKMLDDLIPLTQDFLAVMLGVRRASVSEAAEQLQRAGLISYARGRITVLDRVGLEAVSCGCYRAMQAAYHNSLPDTLLAFSRAPGLLEV